MFPSENNFFELLAYSKDQEQKKNIVKFINKSQLRVLQKITNKLLNGNINLTKIQFGILKNKKQFLRKLSEGKVKNKDLQKEYIFICFIVKLALEHNEICSKISSHTNRKVGKNRSKYSCKRSVSESSSSEEPECITSDGNISTEEFSYSDQNSEIEKSVRFRETSTANSDVSFSPSGEEE